MSATIGAAAAPAHAAGDNLRRIVQQECLPHWQQQHDASPCLTIWMPPADAGAAHTDSAQHGYALMPDRKGGAHLLLIPLRTLSGIESPEILQPDAPNYFAAAWQARTALAMRAGRALTDDEVGLAINSRYSRSEGQLHIHIECQGEALHDALVREVAGLGARWQPLEVDAERYLARFVRGATLEQVDPLKLLHDEVPEARGNMSFYTLVVAGMRRSDGPGFALLARRAFLHGGEALLDSRCVAAGH